MSKFIFMGVVAALLAVQSYTGKLLINELDKEQKFSSSLQLQLLELEMRLDSAESKLLSTPPNYYTLKEQEI